MSSTGVTKAYLNMVLIVILKKSPVNAQLRKHQFIKQANFISFSSTAGLKQPFLPFFNLLRLPTVVVQARW